VTRDPFAELGLTADASESEVRESRRRLAKQHHPDAGGDGARMRAVNAAAADALGALAAQAPRETLEGGDEPTEWRGVVSDIPSFTVEALPAETYEALLLVAADIAEVVDDDPPYRLEVVLHPPLTCWCRLEVAPDAGASSVNLVVGAFDDELSPDARVVRDVWIAALNELDWPDST
jgi:hypothetical protein